MNNYEFEKLSFKDAIARFGQPHNLPDVGDIVLSTGYTGSAPEEGPPYRGQHYIEVCRVTARDEKKCELIVNVLTRIYENDGHYPTRKEDRISFENLRTSTEKLIQEAKDLGLQ